MNDENCPPNGDGKLSAGAAVFGNLVFGTEYPEHSLCYSPSPFVNRNNEDAPLEPMDGKILSYDKRSVSPKKPKEKDEEARTMKTNRGPRHKEPMKKVAPHRAKRAGSKQRGVTTYAEGGSVNPAINGVRRSKENSLKNKMLSVSELREQRRQENEQLSALNDEAEQARRRVIDLKKRLNERFRQSKVERERKLREEHLAKVEGEIQFKSQVHVEHKRTLKEQEDARRRISVDARAKLRKNHQEGTERLKLASIQEDSALLEERYESSVAIRKNKSETAEKRRNSFAFRNGDARRIRELFAEREAKANHDQHASYELKWSGERDADNYKKRLAREKRESLAFRNAEGKRIRDLKGQMKASENHRERESFELKWAGERDADDHRKQMDEERRQSFAFRNSEGNRIRDIESQIKANKNHHDHESFELKWAGERDADGYRKQMEEERRNSLAFRNAEAKRIRDLEGKIKADENHSEHESYELKWAGERDADDYTKQMDKERRQSLAFRNAEGRRIGELESQMKATDHHNEHESYELKWAGERDADDYKKQMEEERRNSYAFRNAEGKSIRDLEGQMKVGENHREHESYELKWAGERDAGDYKKQMDKERRESFAFRNTEGRRIRELESHMKATDHHNEHESYELKWAGERDADDYTKQMEEERRNSIAFRNAEAKRIRDLEGQMKVNENHNEHESYESKWAGERDADDYKKQLDAEQRESLASRNAEAKHIRDLESQMKATDHHNEHESYELKWAGERDADNYRKLMDEERRESLAFRNAEAKRVRDLENQLNADEHHKEHESYELKWAGERDADDYKKQMDEERRESFAARNAEGKSIRDLEGQMKADENHSKHESYEFKWAGERDADDYRKQMDQERRDSFAFRNAEAKRIRDLESQMKATDRHNEHESYELKWAGERDADDYKKQMEEERRNSFAFTNAEAKRHAEVMSELLHLAQEKEKESLLLEWEGQRDAQKYQEECATKYRQQLQLKGKEQFIKRMQSEEENEIKSDEDHKSHLLDSQAWQDVQDYAKECRRRKRLSLACRAKEKRRHFQIKKEQAELQIHQQHIDTYYRSEDARYIELAKLKENARVALESLNQSPGWNPFASLLG